jgi:hypothetical protein
MPEIFGYCSKIFASQQILINEMLKKIYSLLKDHFEHQSKIIFYTIKPFLNKI